MRSAVRGLDYPTATQINRHCSGAIAPDTGTSSGLGCCPGGAGRHSATTTVGILTTSPFMLTNISRAFSTRRGRCDAKNVQLVPFLVPKYSFERLAFQVRKW